MRDSRIDNQLLIYILPTGKCHTYLVTTQIVLFGSPVTRPEALFWVHSKFSPLLSLMIFLTREMVTHVNFESARIVYLFWSSMLALKF